MTPVDYLSEKYPRRGSIMATYSKTEVLQMLEEYASNQFVSPHFNKFASILVDKLGLTGIEEVQLNMKITDDYGADSLDIVELVMETEIQFNMTISDEAMEKLSTVKDCLDYLDKHLVICENKGAL